MDVDVPALDIPLPPLPAEHEGNKFTKVKAYIF